MASPKKRKGAGKSAPAKHAAGASAGAAGASASSAPYLSVRRALRAGRIRTVLVIVATLYLVTVWLDGVGSNLPVKVTPRVWLYFSQVAALFKNAGMMAIDYRAEGWSCADKRWIEVDVRPWFQIDSDTKENRFHRALQFYRKERKVMRALEDYVVERNNASSSLPKVGGVRFLSLRIPYPKVGDHVEPMAHKPLAEYPENIRHEWYWTPTSRRYERCGERPPPRPPTSTDPSSVGERRPVDPKTKTSDDDERSFSGPTLDKEPEQ